VSAALAVAAIGVAAALFGGGRDSPYVHRLRFALSAHAPRSRAPTGSPGERATGTDVATRARRSSWVKVMIATALIGAGVAAAMVAGPAGFVAVVVVVPATRWLRRRRGREAARRARSAAVADACLVIGSELAAGGSASRAMEAAAQEWPELFGPAAGRMAIGGDPVPALRAAAGRPGAEAMAAVAAAWEVAERSGARAAVVLRVVADTVRDEAAVRHEAEAQLSTVRTTARMLAALPPVTLVLFSGGLEPVRFLLRNPYGLACLAGACLLLGLGLAWVGFVRREATRSAWQR
jgi:tight adherence protein B